MNDNSDVVYAINNLISEIQKSRREIISALQDVENAVYSTM